MSQELEQETGSEIIEYEEINRIHLSQAIAPIPNSIEAIAPGNPLVFEFVGRICLGIVFHVDPALSPIDDRAAYNEQYYQGRIVIRPIKDDLTFGEPIRIRHSDCQLLTQEVYERRREEAEANLKRLDFAKNWIDDNPF
jgi:hypothetical protein